ncbi:MAG TPA: molecular chaperone HtpG [Lachnospiraceae bacterium]|nr:molecular chaperone HtpG [Lachnospiraceae bacterium]
MAQEKGNLSINSENFLPIIKKWLYTDKDIFVRELVSNGCDAVTKLKKLVSMGEATVADNESYYINVTVDQKSKTITISDNGIGMTDEEIKQYINQIAFSGASDFLSKYQDKLDEKGEIIGHFGLGFYSAFMVADRVEIDTLSFKDGSTPAKWICDGGIDYELDNGTRQTRGTDIILHVGEDGAEFLEQATMYSTLRKYCAFMPVEIYFDFIEDKPAEENTSEAETENTKAAEETEETAEEEPLPINQVNPLWMQEPKDLTDEDYKNFYHEVFKDMGDPLFWIHLNMDYPFNLKGILYFPRISSEIDALEGEIKLFSNQVYIADNIKEVVPEFLLLLKGVMDCPDMPLNVSRSALQNDGYVSKMSSYITKKVADKLNSIFKTQREQYETFWNDINIFVKYGCMKDDKFYEKVKPSLIFKTTNGDFKTLDEYLDANKEKHENKMFYVSDENQQVQYVNMLKEQGMEAVILSAQIDLNFVSFLEYKHMNKTTFARVDADISETLKNSDVAKDETLNSELEVLFRGTLNNNDLKVEAESLKTSSVSSMMLLSEHSRRMLDMMQNYKSQPELLKMFGDIKPEYTLVLNRNNSLVKKLIELKNSNENKDYTDLICAQLYDLALIGQKDLEPAQLSKFIERSNIIMEKMLEK